MCETLDLPLALLAGFWPTWPPKQGREPQSQSYRQDENCEVNKKPKPFFKVKVHLTLHEHFVDNHKFD